MDAASGGETTTNFDYNTHFGDPIANGDWKYVEQTTEIVRKKLENGGTVTVTSELRPGKNREFRGEEGMDEFMDDLNRTALPHNRRFDIVDGKVTSSPI